MPPFQYAPLDDPSVFFLGRDLSPGETPEAAALDLRSRLAPLLTAPPEALERARSLPSLAFFFGTFPLQDGVLAGNLYGLAFGLGRRVQTGIDPAALAASVGRIDADGWRAMVAAFLAPERLAAAAVLPAR